jgi:hypothetical protein
MSLRKHPKLLWPHRNYNVGQEVTKTTTAAAPTDEDDGNNSRELSQSVWVQRIICGILAAYDLDAFASVEGDVVMAETQRRTLPWKCKEKK